MLVDTGASLVTLTPADARAAGINPAGLVFSTHANTANGAVRMAPVTLREVRIGQLSIYDVPASVLENLNVSLLGMSFSAGCKVTRCGMANSRSAGKVGASLQMSLLPRTCAFSPRI